MASGFPQCSRPEGCAHSRDLDAARRAAVRERDHALAALDEAQQAAKHYAQERDEARSLHQATLAQRDEALAKLEDAKKRIETLTSSKEHWRVMANSLRADRDRARADLDDPQMTAAKQTLEAARDMLNVAMRLMGARDR